MTKPSKKFVSDYSQMSLFDLLLVERDELSSKRPGRMCISAKLLASVKGAIKQAPKSRETLADEMAELSGTEITVHMLNSWCADSHPHRLPAEFIPALCIATGCTEPLRIMNEASGVFTVAGPDALRAEMQKDVEAKRKIEKGIRQKEALIKALEGKQ
ncbi:MAG: hypothetical protein JJE30_05990 [Desulfuromonadales bacterium]|nr:hypothetical protein [Desulfuromonadales bacterium]